MDDNTMVVWITGQLCVMVSIVTVCITGIALEIKAWERKQDSKSQPTISDHSAKT